MQAIILAGGFGTRLRSVLSDVPKPMAPINGKPFLAYLLEYLLTQGVTDIVLSIHYLREQIEDYFKDNYRGASIRYAVEHEPLGTGGAIMRSLPLMDLDRPIFILNGDTFLRMNYQHMYANHAEADDCHLTMALRKVADCSRYGVVLTEGDSVVDFNEAGDHAPGLINAGVYLLNASLFDDFTLSEKFSFEKDFLFPNLNRIAPRSYVVDEYFIDIGIPEDYARASVDFSG
jgi:D-glycero-alpha-D-manno-heptose 1-phosphate guanylyltransferase